MIDVNGDEFGKDGEFLGEMMRLVDLRYEGAEMDSMPMSQWKIITLMAMCNKEPELSAAIMKSSHWCRTRIKHHKKL